MNDIIKAAEIELSKAADPITRLQIIDATMTRLLEAGHRDGLRAVYDQLAVFVSKQ